MCVCVCERERESYAKRFLKLVSSLRIGYVGFLGVKLCGTSSFMVVMYL